MESENVAATSGVASTGNVTSGTASEAMIKAAMSTSSVDTPAGESPAPAPVGAATGDTTKPAGASDPGATAAARGTQAPTGQPAAQTGTRTPVPFDRHEAAVKNARTVGYNDAEKHYEAFKGVDPEKAAVAFDITRDLSKDAKGFAVRLANELGFDLVPRGQQAAGPAQQAPAGTVFPKPRLRAEDGTLAYAADQIEEILKIHGQQVADSLRGEYKPLLEDRETNQRNQEKDAVVSEVRETVSAALEQARKMPHFTVQQDGKTVDNPAILTNLQAIPAEYRRRIGPIAALYMAYQQFVTERVAPTAEAAADQRVRDSYSRKAATSQGNGHPTDQGGDGKKPTLRNGDVDGLARHMERLAETMST